MDPVRRMPVELVCECFGLLDLNGRIAASHVSRAWRRLALADRCLWTTLVLTRQPAEALIALLARSDPLTFAFQWLRPGKVLNRHKSSVREDYDDAVLATIYRNLHRFKALHLEDLPRRLLEDFMRRNAPALEEFRWRETNCCDYFDPEDGLLFDMWALHFPRLRTLDLAHFFIPQGFSPMPNLRRFAAHDFLPGDRLSLADVFPNLETLCLNVSKDCVSILDVLPRSLSSIKLFSSCELDLTPFYHLAHQLTKLKSLSVSDLHSPASEAVQLFLYHTTASGRTAGYSVNMLRRHSMYMESAAHATCHRVRWRSRAQAPWMNRDHNCRGEVATLLLGTDSLSLPLVMLLEINGSLPATVWTRAMPLLRTLTLSTWNGNITWLCTHPMTPTFDAPLLEFVTVHVDVVSPVDDASIQWLANDMPAWLTATFRSHSNSEPRFGSLVVALQHGDRLLSCETLALKRIARLLKVRDLSSGEETEVV